LECLTFNHIELLTGKCETIFFYHKQKQKHARFYNLKLIHSDVALPQKPPREGECKPGQIDQGVCIILTRHSYKHASDRRCIYNR